ncbi:hypothetical protein ACFQ6U_00445 [Streptomyces sp. NPDC056465]
MTAAHTFAWARPLGWTLLVLPLSLALFAAGRPHGCEGARRPA